MGYSSLTYDEFLDCPYAYGGVAPLWADELSFKGYRSISALDFYDDIFGEDLEEERLPDDYITGEYAGIAIERVPVVDASGFSVLDKHGVQVYNGKRTVVTRGNDKLYDLIDRSENFCMMSPISYAGSHRTNEMARYLYALCIEVDYIKGGSGLDELIYSWERKTSPIPKPTYIVCSGNGLHMYYVFERPIPLWKNIFEKFKIAKTDLTRRIWTSYVTTDYEKVQYESVNQSFRLVGTKSKGDAYAMAFEIGSKVTINYLNSFLSAESQLDSIYKATCSLEEAKQLYPDWYNRRIVKGEKRGVFNRYEGIYYNWKEKILSGAVVGKRYNCLENLCSLAVQCNISPEQVEMDCREVAEHFESLTKNDNNHFTEYDVLCALRTYHNGNEQAHRRRIDFISKKTGIFLVANKRNGQKQRDHLEEARAIRDIRMKRKGEEWFNKDGRPSAQEIVQEWRVSNPDGRKADCIKALNLSKPTVYKWWN